MGKSSKEKVIEKMGRVSKWDKANNRFGISIQMERREINGSPQLVFAADSYNMGPCCTDSKEPQKQPLRKEFTDKDAFVFYIKSVIDEAEKEI